MNVKTLRVAAIAAFFGAALLPAQSAELTEAQVFEWWDDGFIAPEEADEILALMDEGNMQEACALAEVYAGEPCDSQQTKAMHGANTEAHQQQTKTMRDAYHGHYVSKIRFDSTGSVSGHREEFQFTFRRLTLRLGSQELLTYKSKRGEAHFGQISTRELHSVIPLDTLWGTALAYSIGKFRFSAMLDTSKATSFGLTVGPFSKVTAQATVWAGASAKPATGPAATGPAKSFSITENAPSASATLSIPSGKISAWYQARQSSPLVRFSFRGKDTSAFSWSTTAYIHGDSIPAPARLSASILRNRFWSTQSVSFRAKDFFDTKATVNARVLSPLHSDSISGRLDLNVVGGPGFLRPALKLTCIEAANDCDQTVLQAQVASAHAFGQKVATFTGGARAKHKRTEHSWLPPRLEIGIALTEIPAGEHAPKAAGSRRNSFRIALVAPESRPDKKTQVRTEARIYGETLEFTLTAAFQRTETENFHPTHAQISAGFFF